MPNSSDEPSDLEAIRRQAIGVLETLMNSGDDVQHQLEDMIMNTYQIEVRLDTIYDDELAEVFKEAVLDCAKTLFAQANLVNRSPVAPRVMITVIGPNGKTNVPLFP